MNLLANPVLIYVGAAMVAALLWLLLKAIVPVHDDRISSGQQESDERLQLLNDMNAAMRSGDISLSYQPKLNLRTGGVEAVEALVRWKHPMLGVVRRNTLITIAEESGRIRELSIWVLRRAVADQHWLAARGCRLAFYINVSGGLLADADFVSEVCGLTASAAGPIGLEITETVLIENQILALANLRRLIQHNVSISIDDYGTGMSSLAYLKELPATELKIDKLFISGMTASHRDPLIVRSTIDLAHALDMTVVAEGVESLATLALLKVMGCDVAQGYLISPALTINELADFLNDSDFTRILADASATLQPPSAFWSRTISDAVPASSTAATPPSAAMI